MQQENRFEKFEVAGNHWQWSGKQTDKISKRNGLERHEVKSPAE
jgi:hypothetical protein